MSVVELDITIHASPDRVWAFVTALRYLPLWLEDVAAVQAISTAQTQAGTTFEMVRTRGQVESWIVLDWEPPRACRLTEYHQDTHLRLRCAPVKAGTQLSAHWEWRASRGLIQRLRSNAPQRQMLERSVGRLAALFDLNRDIRLLHGVGDE
jgi:uncharacterized protein YndB with AHSA1/START domain